MKKYRIENEGIKLKFDALVIKNFSQIICMQTRNSRESEREHWNERKWGMNMEWCRKRMRQNNKYDRNDKEDKMRQNWKLDCMRTSSRPIMVWDGKVSIGCWTKSVLFLNAPKISFNSGTRRKKFKELICLHIISKWWQRFWTRLKLAILD